MGLFSTLNTGVTGLNVNSTGMNVIGDNIANVNTVGFKANRVSFQDLLVQNVIGAAGNSQLGRGATVGNISLNFAQGTFENSPNVTDLAINGQGFFVARIPDSQENLFTRDGQFFLNADGTLRTASGHLLQGFNADATGSIGTVVEDIQINTGIQPPSATAEISVVANLNSDQEVADPADVIDLTSPQYDIDDLGKAAHFAASITVFDTLGEPHDVTMFFQKIDDNQWQWLAVANTEELDGGDPTAGDVTQVGSGSLVFSTDGTLDAASSATNPVTWGPFAGADAQDLVFDFDTEGSLTQYGQESAATALTQDGFGSGFLSFLDINGEGVITGVYSNGQRQNLAQIALANFQSIAGLERRGQNMLGATADSKAPAIGAASTGGRGAITPFALELSNVDLEAEFVKMIATQLGYQANSRVISTTNEMMQQLMQVI